MIAMREVSVGANPIEQARQAWLNAVFLYGDHADRCAVCAVGPARCDEGRQMAYEDGRLWSAFHDARLDAGVFA